MIMQRILIAIILMKGELYGTFLDRRFYSQLQKSKPANAQVEYMQLSHSSSNTSNRPLFDDSVQCGASYADGPTNRKTNSYTPSVMMAEGLDRAM
jgi:hypothetical protein